LGRELSVSVHTFRRQIQSAYRKLQVTSRAEAVIRARELGLLSRSATMGPLARFI
jgi:LuxR family maltose regulon positive regulatory protein